MIDKNKDSDLLFRKFLRFSSATDALSKNIQKYKNDKLSEFGLKSMHLMFLCCLDKADEGMTLGELAKACGVDKAFISRITRELTAMGYVNYIGAATPSQAIFPRYKKQLILTKSGKYIMTRINEMLDEAVSKITDGISDGQFDVFYKVLARLNGNLTTLVGEG